MKTSENLQRDVQDGIKSESLLNTEENGFSTKVGKHVKKFIYIASLVGIGLFFNSCIAGYVETEPNYVENARPPRPSNLHIWIDGDWIYSRHNHGYTRNEGSWQAPVRGRTYVSGHWQATSRGHYWAPGHWQREK
jgi:hypothetical protein